MRGNKVDGDKKLKNVLDENAILKNKLIVQDKELQKAGNQINRLEIELDKLREDKSAKADLEHEVDRRRKCDEENQREINRLTASEKAAAKACEDLEEEVHVLLMKLQQNQDSTESYNFQLDKEKREKESFKKQLDDLREVNRELNDTINQIRQDASEAERIRQEAENGQSDAHQQLFELTNANTKLYEVKIGQEQIIKEKDRQLTELQDSTQRLRESIQQLKEENAQLRKSETAACDRATLMETNFNSQVKQIEQLKSKVNDLNSTIEHAQGGQSGLIQDNKELRNNVNKLDITILALTEEKTKLNQQNTSLKGQLNEMQQQVDKSRTLLSTKSDLFAENEKQINDLNSRVAEMKQRHNDGIQKKTQEIEELKAEIAQKDAKLSEYYLKDSRTRDTLCSKDQKISQLEQDRGRILRDRDEAQKQCKDLSSNFTKLQSQLKSKQQEFQALQKESQTALENQLQAKQDELLSQLDEQQRSNSELKDRVNMLTAKLNAINAEKEITHKRAMSRLEQENRILKTQVVKLEAEQTKKSVIFNPKHHSSSELIVEALNLTIAKQERMIQKLTAENECYSRSHDRSEANLEGCKAALDALETRINATCQ